MAQQDILPTDAGDVSLTKIEANFTELYGKTDKITNASASNPTSIDFAEDTDNGTNKITITAPSAVASDKVLTLPDATGTIALLQTVYPVGSVYTNKTNSTNPSTLFGFGTWTAIAGRVVVGLDATQTEFDTAGETGGAKTHTLTTAQLPSDDFNIDVYAPNGSSDVWGIDHIPIGGTKIITSGGGQAHNNLQPYVVCYVWERIA